MALRAGEDPPVGRKATGASAYTFQDSGGFTRQQLEAVFYARLSQENSQRKADKNPLAAIQEQALIKRMIIASLEHHGIYINSERYERALDEIERQMWEQMPAWEREWHAAVAASTKPSAAAPLRAERPAPKTRWELAQERQRESQRRYAEEKKK